MPAIEKKYDEVLHVLTVEDHPLYRDGLRTVFNAVASKEQLNFTFDEAESGEEGIEKVKHQDYNIIFMDYDLGAGLTGVETIIRILQLKPQIKILGLSSHDEMGLIKEMIDAGARGYLMKNFDKGELLASVKAVLSGDIYYCSRTAKRIQAKPD